ncbi:hypothetical protein EPIR_3044 [Erwinia piriflorinigrans CFBP 5888]|uniref:Uncharacterized protein n=1 Tax=Erwinia piriflorinigrans CFBP 5888 TaxID=1161919 RepID=V5ZBT9_9GAMM|nr:hypothetical protein EPIR_3044 [Erwinia piriflorinigrans CFBP 5888]
MRVSILALTIALTVSFAAVADIDNQFLYLEVLPEI